MHKRYEPEKGKNGLALNMRGFLPLLKALRDPKDPKHGEALDYFGNSGNAENLRWILIQKA